MDSDDSADDDRCEMCGVDPTTRASNLTKRTLMTNAPTGQRCGHRFCGACVERGSQASKGQGSFPCPALGCGAPVRRATLDPRRLDAIEVARDASARARTLAVHNKPRDAFATRRDYDDYLEERENVVHALTYGGAGADAAQKKLKEEAERAATDIARQAAQEADAARRRADAVDDDRRRTEARAARLRESRRRQKDARGRDRDHAVAYALGDRDDAPLAAPPAMQAVRLPRPVGPPKNERVVAGAELDRRRRAGGWRREAFGLRDAFELAACADAGQLAGPAARPYRKPELLFGQRASAARSPRSAGTRFY